MTEIGFINTIENTFREKQILDEKEEVLIFFLFDMSMKDLHLYVQEWVMKSSWLDSLLKS